MSGFKDLAKGGWHPKGKGGGRESWREDFKGVDTVAGWMGKKKTTEADRAQDHISTPLNQLQDPASFGPPPRRTTYGAAAASTAQSPTAPTTIPGTRLTMSTGGLGSPLSEAQLEEDRRLAQEQVEAQRRIEEESKHPTGPYKMNATGLNTANLPPPPKFRGAQSTGPEIAAVAKPPPPSLPPRLPPRQTSAYAPPSSPPPAYASSEADPANGVLNQGAASRLGAAGVKVSGLGIGTSSSPPPPAARSPAAAAAAPASHLSELQSRFSRLNSTSPLSSSASSPPPPPPSGATTPAAGTTWAQKQAALKTASSFHKDPSSVSLADARAAAGTANNFRERHGEQVAAGWKVASGLNQKYGISDRFGDASRSPSAPFPAAEQETGVVGASSPSSVSSPVGLAAGKKKPPPPPAKRIGLGGDGGRPPVPLGSRPNLP